MDIMVTRDTAGQEIALKPDIRITFIRSLHAVTTGLFGRGYTFALRNLMRVVPNKLMSVEFSDGSRFRFKLDDFYWNRIVLKNYQYEPELAYALRAMRDIDYVFLDCGANLGYWSVLVSSEPYGCKRVIAVEASPQTFAELSENCRANHGRFTVLNNALYSEDGKNFIMTDAVHHAARQIDIDAHGAGRTGAVTSTTIDTIISSQNVPPDTPLIIKLDVEGQEINALKGAAKTLNADTLVIYEDHGKDNGHPPTRFVVDELGLVVFYVDENCHVRKVEHISELDAIKSQRGKGYNFFACPQTSLFAQKMRQLAN